MAFLEPRKVYHRTQTDDFDVKPPDTSVELSPLRSLSSFQSGFTRSFRDQSPLLNSDADPIRAEQPFFSKKSLRSVKAPLVVWPTSLYGWRTGALTAALLAAMSLLVNLATVIWLGAHGQGGSLVELYNGDCGKVQTMDIWVHLAINVLSTLLLGGSNYCMQCLSAPTRADVDRAHAEAIFLDIGVPSIRNLLRIPRYKMLLWWALGLSSIPLHLMYNSAFYKSLSTSDYNLLFVTQDFVDGEAFGTLNLTVYNPNNAYAIDPHEVQSSLLDNPDSWERLDKIACINAYATNFLDNRRTLVLVVSNSTGQTNDSVLDTELYLFNPTRAFDWICTADPYMRYKNPSLSKSIDWMLPCESYVDGVLAIADQWQPWGYDVQYSMSQRVPETCSYSGNISIVAVVLACNVVKVVVMLFVAVRLKDNPLITVGDAVESFLNENDRTTEGLCLLSKKGVMRATRSRKPWSTHGAAKYGDAARGKLACRQTKRWAAAASGMRWGLTMGFFLLALAVCSFLLPVAVRAIESYGFDIQTIGFGKVTPAAIISGWDVGKNGAAGPKILGSILIANLPQTILSFLYLHLNGLLTSMWLASEWSDFATQRKTLRVSKPKGSQRSTHFLQLPYKIAIPLMVLSGLLHWLISQSIFLAVVAEYGPTGQLLSAVSIASCGFSPLAMILVIVCGGFIVVATFGLGWFRRYDAGMPLVGSCSMAIAAACHQPDWDTDASLKPVQWGVIPGVVDEKGVGHCAFTSGEVEPLVEGKEYAGISDGQP
ncbi:hypothetical protein A1O7_03266 [Cladophialophora yegresii CBS 114405]|uniref:DUF6536 domain-containing protein n=1 Tax=Cladophialophora yegresii CBS 114405 TaxID=1182544 RepID=W9WE38_9EURO|nr:uncharacterized protein A1O7_03266 [Cladophialophora yegresii CBS 114405]EXJ62826.1 hypothetical protein A1O7_03266 [Cladophialophora yegresii CBS 114405]